MKVVLADFAGACYGVKRALDLAYETARAADGAREVRTLGPLIHNPGVVAELEGAGVKVASDVGEVPCGAVAIIRSHGVVPRVRGELEERAGKVVDATCPHVARAQRGAEELSKAGCRVIVVGEPGHPEVEGLRAYAESAGGKVDVVSSPEEVPGGLSGRIGVVVQTTQRRSNLEAVIAAIEQQGVKPQVKDTICAATRQRQDAAAALASGVDAMVVIGGRNSSNTTRLAEICRAACPRTVHVESADEIDLDALAGCEVVGVTAGASTPDSHIREVLARLADART